MTNGLNPLFLLLMYNLMHILSAPLLLPVSLCHILTRQKYRKNLMKRLGAGLKDIELGLEKRPRIWIHALSVGEVNASLSFMRAIKKRWPDCCLIASSTTSTGFFTLEKALKGHADLIIPAPYDLYPVVNRFVSCLRPECFILVETDLWPNWLWQLKRTGARLLLVNGSISERSARRLGRFPILSNLLFSPFDLLCMQSEEDKARLERIGLFKANILVPGNLKYDIKVPEMSAQDISEERRRLGLSPKSIIWIAGSTHPGEEAILLRIHKRLVNEIPNLQFILAPRNPDRGKELHRMSRELGLKVFLRSQGRCPMDTQVLVLDTLGELVRCYALSRVSFVGGTLVDIGGHNLLEPAAYGVPVTFGRFVESCQEMAQGLLKNGGGFQVETEEQLFNKIKELILNDKLFDHMSTGARSLVEMNKGSVARHLSLLEGLLKNTC